jgi:hypothetical protein
MTQGPQRNGSFFKDFTTLTIAPREENDFKLALMSLIRKLNSETSAGEVQPPPTPPPSSLLSYFELYKQYHDSSFHTPLAIATLTHSGGFVTLISEGKKRRSC